MPNSIKIEISGAVEFDQSKPEGQRASGTLQVKDGSAPPNNGLASGDHDDIQKKKLEAWAKVIDVQMHFNDMSAKNRQFGLAFAGAALGLAIFLLNRQDAGAGFLHFSEFSIHVSTLIIWGSILGVLAVGYFDILHYHTLLRGAVAFGARLERELSDSVFSHGIGLTQAISHHSQLDTDKYKLPGEAGYPAQAVGEALSAFEARAKEYENEKRAARKTARSRLIRFYGVIVFVLALISLAMIFAIRPPGDTKQLQGSTSQSTKEAPAPKDSSKQ